jgi:hypothetical protein
MNQSLTCHLRSQCEEGSHLDSLIRCLLRDHHRGRNGWDHSQRTPRAGGSSLCSAVVGTHFPSEEAFESLQRVHGRQSEEERGGAGVRVVREGRREGNVRRTVCSLRSFSNSICCIFKTERGCPFSRDESNALC